MEVAGPDAQQREAWSVDDGGRDLHVGANTQAAPQQLARGEEHRLPRLGAGGESEQRTVCPFTQAIAAGVLEISHPVGKLVDRLNLGVDDCAVPDRRPDDDPPSLAEQDDQRLQTGNQQDRSSDVIHEHLVVHQRLVVSQHLYHCDPDGLGAGTVRA